MTGSDPSPDLAMRIAAIAADREHGASWLAQEALRVASDCAEYSTARTADEFLAECALCAQMLIDARPGMAPVRFWIERWRGGLERQANGISDVVQLRKRAARLASDLVAAATQARTIAIRNALDRLISPETIFTASYSETVIQACRLAWQSGKLNRVLAAESRSPDACRYGEQLARALEEAGVPVEVVPDAVITSRVSQAQRIWLGADSVFPDGSVLNGVPSRSLAVAGHQKGIPVDVIAEEAKRAGEGGPSESHAPPGFELIPAEAITAVITEQGLWLPPRSN
ncbi:MAG TPA: hypothetical protein VKX96_09455 [Chloroflexota bacterium]|nr:hypothetical protein [Chloroflexota bacterium]